MIVDINPPSAGASLASVVTNGITPVTVYADAARTTPVTLPLALPAYGTTTVYLPAVGQWTATVATPSGGVVWCGGAVSALAGEPLTLRSVLEGADDAGFQIVDGGTP